MHKSTIVLAVTASVLVVAYFVYDYFRPKCAEIFEQTALNVRAKAEMIKTKGEVFIGREKVQELTSSSQKVGQHLNLLYRPGWWQTQPRSVSTLYRNRAKL